jgi:hypothetical protein
MFETFLLRVYYLNDLDEIDCKTCLFILMQSRDNDKMLYSECNARYITMNMMHCWDVWLQWWCNMRMRDSMHDRNGAYDTMQSPWCWPNDAYTMMQGWWYLQCMHIWNAWSMMHTLMSWWCIWLALYNRSSVMNTWVALYP